MINLDYKGLDIINYNSIFLKEIQLICNPLFQNFPINYFLYKRIFQDGHYFLISSDLNITQKFIELIENNKDILLEEVWPVKESVQRYIWPKEYGCIDSCLKVSNPLGIDQGVTIIQRKKEDKSIENIFFATHDLNINIYDFYLNNLEIFSRFVFYFKSKASKIIEHLVTKKLAYSVFYYSKMQNLELEISQSEDIKSIAFNSFIEQTKVTKYTLRSANAHHVTLSKMQIGCLYLLSKGKTAKEIARCFEISPRTVQTHLNFVKDKLGVSSKSCILKYLSKDITDFLEMENQEHNQIGHTIKLRR